MQKNKKWMVGVLCLAMTILALFGERGEMAQAATGNAYLVTTSASYKHPVTGKIEDTGSNEALGQSMTESVLYQKALLEKTSDGKMYLTMRIFMLDNISNVNVWTQKKGSDSWAKASAKVMQKNVGGDYCADYRFEIAQTSIVVRLKLYVVPMGRDVTFYFTFSNAKKGSGDFKTTVQSTSTKKSSSQKATAAPTVTPKSSSAGTANQNSNTSSQKSQTVTAETSDTKSADSDAAQDETLAAEDSTAGDNSSQTSTDTVTENSPESGRELLDETDGLVLSDDSYLAQESLAEETTNPAGVESEDQNTQEEGAEQAFRLSWVFVFQCILIITVPSLVILGCFLLYLEIRKRNLPEKCE